MEDYNYVMNKCLDNETFREGNMFEDKNIVVFGGTGSIGTLIVEELLNRDINTVRVFANSEFSLWKTKQRFLKNPQFNKLRFLLGDVTDFRRVKRALRNVTYCFNASAVKQIPIAEDNPLEAVNVNILGLVNILDGCIDEGVKKVLHISTDKAIRPLSIMGATKMICERVLQVKYWQNPQMDAVITRMGNIYGTRGSFVQVIRKCVKNKEPITLTDPKMRRFFIMPEDAKDFMFQAFENGHNGEIWIPKLKEWTLDDVVKREAGEGYPVEIIGIREGEKLSEKLITPDELKRCKEFEDKWVIPYK